MRRTYERAAAVALIVSLFALAGCTGAADEGRSEGSEVWGYVAAPSRAQL